MFVIRNATPTDLHSIYELSQLMQFINIPNDKDLLEKKIQRSIDSFSGKLAKEDSVYIFVLEDLEKQKIIGVSLIHGLHGTETEPHFYLTVAKEEKYSQSLNTGFIHGTLKFGHLTDGHTEIGGLILDPSYRGHSLKLGKALSFSRFLFIGENRNLFTDMIHVELMPPFDSEGRSPLWEAVGRKFLNMNYHEADKLSRKNKEFILSLFPSDTIYESLLPLKARDAIGKVGEQTQPVKRMLESIGFLYTNEVDPFDGGPHYRAKVEDITLIKGMKSVALKFDDSAIDSLALIKNDHDDYSFYCPIVETNNELTINKKYQSLFKNKNGIAIKY